MDANEEYKELLKDVNGVMCGAYGAYEGKANVNEDFEVYFESAKENMRTIAEPIKVQLDIRYSYASTYLYIEEANKRIRALRKLLKNNAAKYGVKSVGDIDMSVVVLPQHAANEGELKVRMLIIK
jgi:hypothetical protein